MLESVGTLTNQQRVPEARVPAPQGDQELRMHVNDTVSIIIDDHIGQLGNIGRHMGGLSDKPARNRIWWPSW